MNKRNKMKIIRTILADEFPVVIEGVKAVLGAAEEHFFDITATYDRGDKLLKEQLFPAADLLILDLNLPKSDGYEVIREVRKQTRQLGIIVFSRFTEQRIVRNAMRLGADAYIYKDGNLEELFVAAKAVMQGGTYLSEHSLLNNVELKEVGRKGGRSSFEERAVEKYQLTPRELQILGLITQAFSNKEIAKKLFISDQTVSVHRKNIMRKIGVSNTAGLIRTAFEYSLV